MYEKQAMCKSLCKKYVQTTNKSTRVFCEKQPPQTDNKNETV